MTAPVPAGTRAPGPTPAAPSGAPHRVPSAIVDALAERVQASPERRDALLAEFWSDHAQTPIVGATQVIDGVELAATTFLWRDEATSERAGERVLEVMLHINSLTDRHRDTIEPALLAHCEGTDVWHLSSLLPTDLIASYRLVVATAATGPLPRDAGESRAAWMRIHQLGAPDPRNGETLRHPLGTASSVLTMPAAVRHPAWGDGEFRRGSTVQLLDVPRAGGAARRVWLYRPLGAQVPNKLLVLFDGEMWSAVGLQDALDRWDGPDIAVAMVASMGPERRAADLPNPEAVAAIIEHEVLGPVHAALGRRYGAADLIASGQSYGGLAAAGLVITRPDLVGSAIAQSASFHYRAGEELQRGETRPGDLSNRLQRDGAEGRIVLSVGLEEGILLEQARLVVARAAATALRLSYREVRGGHDYAWWRSGLLWGLDELSAEWGDG